MNESGEIKTPVPEKEMLLYLTKYNTEAALWLQKSDSYFSQS